MTNTCCGICQSVRQRANYQSEMGFGLGALVAWTASRYADLMIGFIISLIVLNRARRIWQLNT